jgi:hypothetical protein
MELDRYTLLGFFAVIVIPATLVGGTVYALTNEPTKTKVIAPSAAVVSTAPVAAASTVVEKPVVVAAAPVVKEPIVIKGIYIGMPEAEFKSVTKRDRYNFNDTITIGGVETDLYSIFEGGVLKSATAGYLKDGDGDSYLKIKQAIQSKYSNLKCDTNEVRNRMNAKFDAQICWYNDGNSHLRIAFRDGSVDYSTFQLFDVKWNNEQKAKKTDKTVRDI